MNKTKKIGIVAGSMVAALAVTTSANEAETYYSSDLGDANTLRPTLLDQATPATYDL